MVIGIAELMVDHGQTLGEMRQGIFPSHGNAAMQLDGFLSDQPTHAADEVLCCRAIALAFRPRRFERTCCQHHR